MLFSVHQIVLKTLPSVTVEGLVIFGTVRHCFNGTELIPGVKEQVLHQVSSISKLILLNRVYLACIPISNREINRSEIPANNLVNIIKSCFLFFHNFVTNITNFVILDDEYAIDLWVDCA